MTRRTVLIDLDHTLSAAWPRDHMIGSSSWDDYHNAAPNDEPIHDMVQLINTLGKDNYDIVAITARPEKFRRITMDWCLKHGICIDELLMRADEEFRPSPEMKLDLANARFPDIKSEVAFVIEDRDDVCAAFRELGVTVLQCFARRG